MGLDVFGEDTVDTFLGPNKKNSGRNASHQDGQHVNTQSAEDRPTWDGTADDIDARADSSASTRFVDIFGIARSPTAHMLSKADYEATLAVTKILATLEMLQYIAF